VAAVEFNLGDLFEAVAERGARREAIVDGESG